MIVEQGKSLRDTFHRAIAFLYRLVCKVEIEQAKI